MEFEAPLEAITFQVHKVEEGSAFAHITCNYCNVKLAMPLVGLQDPQQFKGVADRLRAHAYGHGPKGDWRHYVVKDYSGALLKLESHVPMTEWPSRSVGDILEFQLDPVIALRIKELRLGHNGNRVHSWRALAIKVTGYECQMTGSDLERLAQWTLGEDWETSDT